MQRTELLMGSAGVEALQATHVLVVGLGGVGSFSAEFLVRAGIGAMTIVDGDTVDLTNKNRQLVALDSTVGRSKVAVMAERLRDINPDLKLQTIEQFLDVEGARALVASCCTGPGAAGWVVDCIDSVAPKAALVAAAFEAGATVVTCMGAGGRVDPSCVKIAPLMTQTYADPFATYMRKCLRKNHGFTGSAAEDSRVIAVFSEEIAAPASLLVLPHDPARFKRSFYGTISYLPSLFAIHATSVVVNTIVGRPLIMGQKRVDRDNRAVIKAATKAKLKEKRQQKKILGAVEAARSAEAWVDAAASEAATLGGGGGGGGGDIALQQEAS